MSILDVIATLLFHWTKAGTDFPFTFQLGGPGKYLPVLQLKKGLSCLFTLYLNCNISIPVSMDRFLFFPCMVNTHITGVPSRPARPIILNFFQLLILVGMELVLNQSETIGHQNDYL